MHSKQKQATLQLGGKSIHTHSQFTLEDASDFSFVCDTPPCPLCCRRLGPRSERRDGVSHQLSGAAIEPGIRLTPQGSKADGLIRFCSHTHLCSECAGAMSTWKNVGMTYLKYADLCATHVRNALKEPAKTKAMAKSDMHARVMQWTNGKRGTPGTLRTIKRKRRPPHATTPAARLR